MNNVKHIIMQVKEDAQGGRRGAEEARECPGQADRAGRAISLADPSEARGCSTNTSVINSFIN